MKEYNLIETIRLFVMKAQTQKAIDELYSFLNETKVEGLMNELIILSSNYHDVEKSANLGMGRYAEEKNRINMALLKMLEDLEQEDRIKVLPKSYEDNSDERLKLIESKIDFLLNHVEKNDDLLFYGIRHSSLWNLLEEKSRENLVNANIIEKEARQDTYQEAVRILFETVMLELEAKFLSKCKLKLAPFLEDRNAFMDQFTGMNKNKLYTYVKEGKTLSLNQLSEILLSNILQANKRALQPAGKIFFSTFHDHYKIRRPDKVEEFFEKYSKFRVKGYVTHYTQTLVDVVVIKDDIINLLINLQPKNHKVKKGLVEVKAALGKIKAT